MQTFNVEMPDGCRLATDVILPDGPGPFPVVLTRTPYHRTGLTANPSPYAAGVAGSDYAYVVQDVRGKFDSEGTFRPLWDEAADGAATLDWIADQPWCNGRIGMTGMSYLGMVQGYAASSGHEALRCILPGICPQSYFIDWLRYDGCFALANAIRWSMTHNAGRVEPKMDHFTWADLWRQVSVADVFARAGFEAPALREWVEHDVYDDYWRGLDLHPKYASIKVPGLHTGGWFDHITRGQFQAYQGIRDHGASDRACAGQRLLIGPWGHMTVGGTAYGEWDFGPDAAWDRLSYERRLLDLWLKDIDDGIADEPPVRLFVMGVNRWMDFADWPVPGARTTSWYLGLGHLDRAAPANAPPDSYSYDPSDPCPTLGGVIYWGIEPAGPVDQRPILGRQDVLLYRSNRLPTPLAVVGEIDLELWITSDAPDTDFIAKLCVVESGGRVTCLTLGSLRCRYRDGWDRCVPLEKDEPTPIRLQLGQLAYVFPVGSRIALMVTSSSFPRILPHPNTMAPTWTERSPRVAVNRVLHDTEHPSRLLLPVIDL